VLGSTELYFQTLIFEQSFLVLKVLVDDEIAEFGPVLAILPAKLFLSKLPVTHTIHRGV
jgi:hypothetical protein